MSRDAKRRSLGWILLSYPHTHDRFLYSYIAGLILVDEPYYNEAGYEKQRGTQHAQENSRMYNEMAILKLVQVSGTDEQLNK